MNARFVAVALLVLVAIGMGDSLYACGEKYLVRGRGTRFQSAAPARSAAAILIYANPALNVSKALANVPVDATLRKVGYRPTVVTSTDAFNTALSAGGWDLVVVDLADGAAVRSRLQGAKAPIVLPVAFNVTSAELAAAKKEYRRVLKGPTKNQAFLEAIDDALALRSPAHERAGG